VSQPILYSHPYKTAADLWASFPCRLYLFVALALRAFVVSLPSLWLQTFIHVGSRLEGSTSESNLIPASAGQKPGEALEGRTRKGGVELGDSGRKERDGRVRPRRVSLPPKGSFSRVLWMMLEGKSTSRGLVGSKSLSDQAHPAKTRSQLRGTTLFLVLESSTSLPPTPKSSFVGLHPSCQPDTPPLLLSSSQSP